MLASNSTYEFKEKEDINNSVIHSYLLIDSIRNRCEESNFSEKIFKSH